MSPKIANKVFLCILDGFSIGDRQYKYNAVFQAKTPNFQRFLTQYPNCMLQTSGLSVGLPEGQMGNSEVGHATIGSGRVVYQYLPKINLAIANESIFTSPHIQNCLKTLQNNGRTLHLVGLASNGGVHSHIDHILAIANHFANGGVAVKLHLITDGRDVAPKSFATFYEQYIGPQILGEKNIKVATLCGRYFAMDRDGKMERTQSYYDLIACGANPEKSKTFEVEFFANTQNAMQYFYNKDIGDEFIKPSIVNANYYGFRQGDAVFMANFRSDRARQIFEMICNNSAGLSHKIAMTHYSDAIVNKCGVVFEKDNIQNTLAQTISEAGLLQLHTAETEKYAHVTFFFNGGVEQAFKGEERILVPSPSVPTYDLQPQMSLPQLTAVLQEAIEGDKYSFIVCNVANGDMVGHSGNFEAAKKAAEFVDEFLGKMEALVLSHPSNYTMLVTADHGNLEEMIDKTTGEIHTQHTTNAVPFIYVAKNTSGISLQNGGLNNIAPTVLKILGLQKPTNIDNDLFTS